MNREIITTEDGSKTIYIKHLNETYHSQNGAIQEAHHVFIKNGLIKLNNYQINILELGFGTGLNVLVTINELLKNDKNHIINYFTIEKYPVTTSEIETLDYAQLFDNENIKTIQSKIHDAEWGVETKILDNFYLTKIKADFFDLKNIQIPPIDLVYFDCFGAKVQPDLWGEEIVTIISEKVKPDGLLTTYSSKGSFRRALINHGFSVEKLDGPPGKREMINATKIN